MADSIQEIASTDVDAQLDQLETRLVDELTAERDLDADTVRRVVHDEREQYADASVHVFVPILVERGVRQKLATV